jgi:hypothetical protein
MFTFWNNYVLKLLRLETITFSDATLGDINVVLCYVLSQYPLLSISFMCLSDCLSVPDKYMEHILPYKMRYTENETA